MVRELSVPRRQMVAITVPALYQVYQGPAGQGLSLALSRHCSPKPAVVVEGQGRMGAQEQADSELSGSAHAL